MPEYLSPGVYVEEVDRGPKPIEGVGTAMAAFVGFTEKAEIVRDNGDGPYVEDLLNKPQLVTNWTQFVDKFGGFVPGLKLPHAVYGYFSNGGTRCYVCSVRTFPKASATLLNASGKPALRAEAKQAGFDAMQLRLRVAGVKGVAAASTPVKAEVKKDEKGAEKAPEAPAPTAAGDVTFNFFVEKKAPNGGWTVLESFEGAKLESVGTKVAVAWPNNKAPKFVDVEAMETSITAAAPREQEQMLIMDQNLLAAPKAAEFSGDVAARTGVDGLEVLDDVTMVVVPDLMTTMPGEKLDLEMVKSVQAQMIAHCERCGDRVAILDTPPNMTPQEVKAWRMETTGFDSSYAAMYYPWIKVSDTATDKIMGTGEIFSFRQMASPTGATMRTVATL